MNLSVFTYIQLCVYDIKSLYNIDQITQEI